MIISNPTISLRIEVYYTYIFKMYSNDIFYNIK